jgi:uncharacterized membrane protein
MNGHRTAEIGSAASSPGIFSACARPSLVVFLLALAYGIIVRAETAGLPGRVAIHFGANGEANSFAPRDQLGNFFEASLAAPFFLLLLALTMPLFPSSAFNLPHREFWLAPARRAATVANVSRQLIWLDCLLIAFLAGLFQLTVAANHRSPPHLPMNWFLPLIIGFLLATVVWSSFLLRTFKGVPTDFDNRH